MDHHQFFVGLWRVLIKSCQKLTQIREIHSPGRRNTKIQTSSNPPHDTGTCLWLTCCSKETDFIFISTKHEPNLQNSPPDPKSLNVQIQGPTENFCILSFPTLLYSSPNIYCSIRYKRLGSSLKIFLFLNKKPYFSTVISLDSEEAEEEHRILYNGHS